MNWKILGKALLVTIVGALSVAIIILAIIVFPWWITAIILFVGVFALIYSQMKADYEFDNPNDRMSWNYDNEEEEDETDAP